MSKIERRRTDDFLDLPTPSSRSPSFGGYWKQNLYLLQEKAPRPTSVHCTSPFFSTNKPNQYGVEYHGLIPRERADHLLNSVGEGAYLVRESQRSKGACTLCMRFDEKILNYKLYYDGQHYVGDKRFDTLDDLVADGLISMYVDKHAADYIKRMADEAVYEESPYIQYQKSRQNGRHSDGANDQCPAKIAQKAHRFVGHTFRIPHYCDFCRNFMWGLVQQGLRCEDCGFAAHKKCSERTLLDCRPDLKYVRRMFAVDLTTLCMAHQVVVPPVVVQCLAEVEKRGLLTEGIYRISGSHDEIDKLRQALDTCGGSNQRVNLGKDKVEDVHTVAGLVKLYLRLLPQPLVTYSVCKNMTRVLKGARNDYEKVRAVKTIVHGGMEPTHQRTLHLLLAHLCLVAEHNDVNKMTLRNLATIFSPTVLCCSANIVQGVIIPQQEQYLLLFLLVNHANIFAQQR